MRINSDFRDYYDCIQATGQDQTFVYQRFAREEILTHYPFHATANYSYEQGGLHYNTVNIGFCGRVYPALKVNRHKWHIEGNKDNIKYCYSLDDIDNYVNEYCDKKEQEGYYYHYKNGHSVKIARLWPWNQRRKELELFFTRSEEYYKQNPNKHRIRFEENHCPVFYAIYDGTRSYHWNGKNYEYKIVYDGKIGQFDFARIFDPYRAYQEVAMFLGSLAVPLKPIPEISDKIMAEIKGFDKYSFRKDPSSKKKK